MATISALGIGSGLDLNGLLDQLSAAEREKLAPITQAKKSYEAKISAYGKLRSALAQFQSAAAKLNKTDMFDAVKSSVTGTALTAAADKGTSPGSYNVNVSQLARAYSVATAGVVDREADLGAGTITIALANGDNVAVDIDAGNSSMEAIRDAINAQGGGVNAAIVNDGSGTPYRLSLTSKDSGEDAAITSVDFGNLAGSLALDPATEVLALNAEINVNGIDIVSQSNQVDGAVEGLTLSLAEEGEATVTVSTDNEAIEEAINKFVASYNKLQEEIDKLTSFNAETGDAGELLGDSTMRSVQSRLRSVFVAGVAEGELQRLSDLGISLELDGTLEIDESAIKELVATDRQALADFFAAGAADDGLAGKLDSALDQILKDSGLLDNATDGLESRVDRLDERYERVELSIARTIERYRQQFAQLDGLVANMNSKSAYIAQQFDILNAQLKQ